MYFGPKDLALLLERSFRSEHLARSLGYQVALASDGNPFFVFEIVRDLRERRWIRQTADGSWKNAREIDRIEIPPSVLDLVNARVAELDERERDLLDVAACCGCEFDPALLGAVVGLTPVPLLRALARIERRHRLVRSTGARIAFDHQQVQEALHASLPEALRRTYHTEIARTIEARHGGPEGDVEALDRSVCAELCEHFLRGGEAWAAARYLGPALEHLAAGHLHTEAVALAERALEAGAATDEAARLDVLLRQATSLDVLGRREDERRVLDAALPIAEDIAARSGDRKPLARAQVALGSHLFRMSSFDEADAALRRGLEWARDAGDARTEGRAAGTLGSVALWRGKYREAVTHFEHALELARKSGAHHEESSAVGNLGSALNRLGRHDEARELYERSLALAVEHGFPAGEASARCNLAIICRRLGDFEHAREHFEAALSLSRMLGYRRGEIADTGNLGNLFFSLGRYDDARRHHEECLTLAKEIGDRRWQGLALHNLANAWSQLGDVERAHEMLVRSREIAEEIGDRGGVDYGDWLLGDLAAWTKDLVAAEEHLRRAVESFRAAGSVHELAGSLVSLGAHLARTARGQEARELFDEAIELVRGTGFCGPVVLARCRLALLFEEGAGSTAARAVETLERCCGRLEEHERLEARLLLWRATGDVDHLRAAHAVREEILAENPPQYHEAMLRNVPAHRDVVAAWIHHGDS